MADILIRGMEMPKDSPALVFVWPDGRVHPYGVYESKKWEGVNAIPLPAGHGRLIDADALRQHILSEEEHYGYLDVHDLRNAPTIIEADLEWKMKNCCCFSNTDSEEGGTDNGN